MKKNSIKILVVEDSCVQIEWAKQELAEYNVTIAKSRSEAAYFMKNNVFDLILTDLEFPLKEGGGIDCRNGLDMFEKAMEQIRKGVTKGAAIVSNFEGHHQNYETEKSKEAHHILSYLNLMSDIKIDLSTKALKKDALQLANVVIFFGASFDLYDSFLMKNGEIVSLKDLSHREKTDLSWKEGTTYLKPYKKIVEALLS